LKFSVTYQNAPKWSFREQYGLFTSSLENGPTDKERVNADL